ncbi:DUF4142 domain-containing protein [Ferrovibrio terrae]|uniref:DUF4142 domain-containing protein n=1 Tax=Ferrovibrio terrae TaxID=2594003 RepID=UPI003138240F
MIHIRKLALLGATAMVAVGIIAAPVLAQTTQYPSTTAQKSRATSAKPLGTTDYLASARTADLFEVEASKIAVQRAQNKQVRDYAQRVLDDHALSSPKLNDAAIQAGLTPTTPLLTVKQAAKLNELQKASLSSFDKNYILSQIDVHERELRLHTDYARTGDAMTIKNNSTVMMPLVRKHIADAKQISGALANNAS